MEKYIDAEKLIAEIDRQKIGYNTDGEHAAEYNTCRKILDIITSLQQEQQKEPDKSLEEAAEAYQQQVIEETKNHIHLPQHTYAEGFEDALHLISDAFKAGWEYRSECEESSIMGDLLKNILKVGVQHNFGFGPDLKQCKDNEDESK